MSDFFERLKFDLDNPRNYQGCQNRILVNLSALRELMEQFETLESVNRVLCPESKLLEVNHRLHDAIVASYHLQNRSAESTLMSIMDTLYPLMVERQKDLGSTYRPSLKSQKRIKRQNPFCALREKI